MTNFPEEFGAADKIKQTLEQTFEFIEKETGLGRLMTSLALQPDVFTSLKPKLDQVQEKQIQLFKEIMWDLGCDQPELEAYQLGALMDGILMGRLVNGDEYPLAELKQKILEEYVPD